MIKTVDGAFDELEKQRDSALKGLRKVQADFAQYKVWASPQITQHGIDQERIRALESALRTANADLKAVWIETGKGLEGLKRTEVALGITPETNAYDGRGVIREDAPIDAGGKPAPNREVKS